MPYPISIKEKAILLRKRGHSIKEIAKLMKIAQSTSSLWTSKITLSESAQNRLKDRRILGQYKSIGIRRNKKNAVRQEYEERAYQDLSQLEVNKTLTKLLCSIFFWTEGGKSTDNYVYFINSDPEMVKLFVTLLRKSFTLDEKKFRALIHIHSYHNESEVKKYWSEIINLPINQFSKSYQKVNTQKRIREGYQGCIRIRYYNVKIALELRAFYNMLIKIF